MNKTYYISGFLLGLILPLLGIFIGLQINSMLGTILAFPFVLGAYLSGLPFGEWTMFFRLLALLSSGIFWGCIIHYGFSLKKKK